MAYWNIPPVNQGGAIGKKPKEPLKPAAKPKPKPRPKKKDEEDEEYESY